MKNESPLVSIVIPVYNREKYINIAIESAVNQTHTNIEIIIGDNKSTDNTWNILKEWESKDKRIKIFQNETNIGPVFNWMECFKRVTGKYIKIIWSDDWIDNNYIEQSLKIFDEDTAFVISNYIIVNENGTENLHEIVFPKNQYSTKYYLDKLFCYNEYYFPVSPGCALFRTSDVLNSFITEINNTDNLDSKKNGAGNDLLLFLITASRYKCIRITESHSYFRAHKDSFSTANSLSIFYEWAKLFYAQNYDNTKKYQSFLKYFYLKEIRRKNKCYQNLYKSSNFSFKGILYLITYIFFNKIKRCLKLAP